MATSKRKRIRSNPAQMPAAASAATFSATPGPGIDSSSAPAPDRAAASQASLSAERASLFGRRAVMIGLALVLILLIPAIYALQQLTAGRATPAPAAVAPPAPTVVPTSAPAAAIVIKPTVAPAAAVVVAPTVAPAAPAVVAPTVAPAAAVVVAPTVAPAAPAVVAPTAVPPVPAVAAPAPAAPAVQNLCVAVAGLPVYDGAACSAYDADQDDGIIKHENTYATNAAVDDVRRFYEAAFASNGWTVTEFKQDIEDNTWEYSVAQGLRRVEVKVQPELTPGGVVTEIKITEK